MEHIPINDPPRGIDHRAPLDQDVFAVSTSPWKSPVEQTHGEYRAEIDGAYSFDFGPYLPRDYSAPDPASSHRGHSKIPSPHPSPSKDRSSTNSRYHCLVCTASFATQSNLKRHSIQKHTTGGVQEEEYFCDYKRCARSEAVYRNTLERLGQLPNKQIPAGIGAFRRKDHLKAHLREQHQEPVPERNFEADPGWAKDKIFKEDWWRCTKCLKRVWLQRQRDKGSNEYKCSECGSLCEGILVELRSQTFKSASSDRNLPSDVQYSQSALIEDDSQPHPHGFARKYGGYAKNMTVNESWDIAPVGSKEKSKKKQSDDTDTFGLPDTPTDEFHNNKLDYGAKGELDGLDIGLSPKGERIKSRKSSWGPPVWGWVGSKISSGSQIEIPKFIERGNPRSPEIVKAMPWGMRRGNPGKETTTTFSPESFNESGPQTKESSSFPDVSEPKAKRKMSDSLDSREPQEKDLAVLPDDVEKEPRPLAGYPISRIRDTGISLRSFTESNLDTSSIASSASSFRPHVHATSMVSSLVQVITRDPEVDGLLTMLLSKLDMEPEPFTRNFCKILRSYSRHLREQVVEDGNKNSCAPHYRNATKFVRNARHQISYGVVSKYKVFPKGKVGPIAGHLNQLGLRLGDFEESTSGDSSEEEDDFPLGDIKLFLVSGEAFRHLKRSLWLLIIPNNLLHHVYDSVNAFLDRALSFGRNNSFLPGLARALATGHDILSEIGRIIRALATDIKLECTDNSQLDLASFLAIYAEYIAVVATDRVRDLVTDHKAIQRGEADRGAQGLRSFEKGKDIVHTPPVPHGGMLETIIARTLPSLYHADLSSLPIFPASSEAWRGFIEAMTDLAYPSFFSKAARFVQDTIRSAEESEDLQLALEGQLLLPIIKEMQSCLHQDDTLISFSEPPNRTDLSMLNKLKIAIETSTAAEWDWWPLQPPQQPESPDRAKISWKCACGTDRHEYTLPYYANRLQSISNELPLSSEDNNMSMNRPSSSHSNHRSVEAASGHSADSSPTDDSERQSASSSFSSRSSAITSPDDGDVSLVDFGTATRRYIYIFFLVATSEYRLATIDVSSMKARDFFKALRTSYNVSRGFWRRTFSIFVYNHCDFIKIIRPEPHTFMPGEQKFELPSEHDDEYHYRPKPAYSAPITRHVFRHYFYGCYDSGTLSHRFHTSIPLVPNCRVRNPPSELLDFFPKRDRSVAEAAQSDKVEVCYGLLARECRSFFRVVMYLFVTMAPAFWFVFAWLFEWGNSGDLQDATVPITLMVSAVSLLWAVVYSGTDMRKEYGD